SLAGDVSEGLIPYFIELEHKNGIKLTDGQKAWYSAKWKVLGDDMRREYPSTPEEAFNQSIEGAYFAKQFTQLYKEGRIAYDFSEYSTNKGPVNVVCDIGIGDSTALWFWRMVGNEPHIVHYHENSGEPLGYYIKYIQDKITAKKWELGKSYGPHDMNNREFASKGKTRKELAAEGVEYGEKVYRMK
ncbi:MAG: terminase, partial [Pseudoalteromonas sp.]